MQNEFKKLIKKVFGREQYNTYMEFTKEQFRTKSTDVQEMYDSMHKQMEGEKRRELLVRLRQVDAVMESVLRICRTYYLAIVVYVIAMVLVLALGNTTLVKGIGCGLLTLAFLYKTYECISNKYCFVDTRIVVTYRLAILKLLVAMPMELMPDELEDLREVLGYMEEDEEAEDDETDNDK